MRAVFTSPNTRVLALGIAFFALYPLHGHFVERRDRREVLAHGAEAIALVESSSGLESVVLGWTDSASHARTGEAWTRKQVSGRRFVGNRVAIKYVDDPAVKPVILSEVAAREWSNEFGLFWNPVLTVVLGGAMIWLMAVFGARSRSPGEQHFA